MDDKAIEQGAPGTSTPEQLAAQLAEERALLDLKRIDERERRRLEAIHRDALAQIEQSTVSRRRARRERDRDEVEQNKLAELYRTAARSGVRARIRADINRSAEVRALRVELVRKASLWIGLPVLVAFGLWSTAGVQRGVATLLHLEAGSFGWMAAWLMEPALLAIVALIIVARSLLESSGGTTDWKSWAIEVGALGTSLALNITPSLSAGGDVKVAALVAESVGPIFAAVTAFLIGLFNSYVSKAQPWEGAPRLAELNLGESVVSASGVASDVVADALEVTQPEPVPTTERDRVESTRRPVTRRTTKRPAAPVTQPDAANDAPVTHDVTQSVTHDADAPVPAGDAQPESDAPAVSATAEGDAPGNDAPASREERLTLAVWEVLHGTAKSARAAALAHDVDIQAVQRRVRAEKAKQESTEQSPLARAGVNGTVPDLENTPK